MGSYLVSRILTGNEFQTLEVENRKARDPNDNLWRGTKSWWELDERRDLLGSWCCRRSESYCQRFCFEKLILTWKYSRNSGLLVETVCVRVCRSNLLGGTSAFADDPWAAVEERANQASDDHTLSVDQIRQQQQQMIAGVCFSRIVSGRIYFLQRTL